MNTAPQTTDVRGGVIVDIATLPLNKQLAELRTRMRDMLRITNLNRRAMPRVSVRPDQYARLMSAANNGRAKSLPEVIGLAVDAVPIATSTQVQP